MKDTGKSDLGLGMERLDIASQFILAVKSPLPHKVGSRDEIYSARWNLMLIS